MDKLIDIRKNNILVLDIETAYGYSSALQFKRENKNLYTEFLKKYDTEIKDCINIEKKSAAAAEEIIYKKYSPLIPEYGRILTCSFTTIKYNQEEKDFRLNTKSFYDTSESDLLSKINSVLSKDGWIIAGMNINNFDIPFIIKRMIANNIKPSKLLIQQVFSKPWEKAIIDIADIWSFGKFGPGSKSTKLGAICEVLNVESPKDEISGPDVPYYYWHGSYTNLNNEVIDDEHLSLNERLITIDEYCQKDTISTAKCLIAINNLLF